MRKPSSVELTEYYAPIRLRGGHQLMNDRRGTSRSEARAYYDSFIEEVPFRVIQLLSWHKECYTGDVEADLRRIGKKVTEYVSRDYSYFTEDKVIGEGEKQIELKDSITMYYHAQSMLIDMGLFLAVMLNDLDHPDIKWELRTSGGKKGINYHQAVLNGPGRFDFNPLWQSGSIGASLIKGETSHNYWAEYYLMWLDVIEGREPRSMAHV